METWPLSSYSGDKNQEKWQTVILQCGVYGTEKRMSGRKVFVPLEQQPMEDQILKVHCTYKTLKADTRYKRRVTWIEQSRMSLACVEYIGRFPSVQ